jgi:hypothetical protein
VSVPSTLRPTAPVQMLCPRPHANIRFHDHLLTPIRSLASLAPPFRRAISVRPTAPRSRQTASATAHRLQLRSSPPARQLSRSATRSGRAGQCGP